MKLRAFTIALVILGACLGTQIFAQPDEHKTREREKHHHEEKEEHSRERQQDFERQVHALKKEMNELLEAGRREEAARVKQEIGALMRESDRDHDSEADERRRIHREIRELQERGRHEQAEHLQRKYFGHDEHHGEEEEHHDHDHEGHHENEEHGEHHGREGEHHGDRDHHEHEDHANRHMEEMHRKINHLHMAMENLQMAGYHDLARELEKEAHAVAREIRRHEGGEHGHEGTGSVDHEARQAIGHLERQIREMQHQMERMQQAIHRIHQHLEKSGDH